MQTTTQNALLENIARGIVCISATFNNTNVTVTDEMGNVLCGYCWWIRLQGK